LRALRVLLVLLVLLVPESGMNAGSRCVSHGRLSGPRPVRLARQRLQG
jgi:hypothetical protein